MKILIADKFERQGLDKLAGLGEEVFCEPGLKGPDLAKRLADLGPQILIVRSTKVPAEVLRASRALKLIIRAGAGVDNIDVPIASELGISVSNCPGMNACAVAELTLGLIIAMDRRIPDNVLQLRERKWNKSEFSKGLGLKGRTLGVIGAGRIGTEVARRALALDMFVLFTHLGRNLRLADFPNCRRADLDDLLRQSDVVTLHIPGGESTKHLIDERRLRLMKPSALIVNTARASVIDEQALAVVLREGRIRAAALDVYENEPTADAKTINSPLCDIPNLYGTHHIGASTEQAQLAIADETVRIVTEYKLHGQVLNCVNVKRSEASCMLVVRFINKPGGLAHVFNHLSTADINVEEMDHLIYDGGKAACAHIRLNRQVPQEVLDRIQNDHPYVMAVEVLPLD